MTGGVLRRFWNTAWPILALGNLLWAGNIVLGRGVAGEVPPVTLAYWRWTGAFLLALPFAWKLLRRDLPLLRRRWPMMLLLSATGIASYNTLSYISLNYTTALNVLLLQSAMPLIILVWAFALFGERPSLRQAGGGAGVADRGGGNCRTRLGGGVGSSAAQSGRCNHHRGDGYL